MQSYATDLEKTDALHNEIAHSNVCNVTLETHPILYTMVEELITKLMLRCQNIYQSIKQNIM